ncbi:hypothetical protein ACWAT4_21560 [Bradyrhizobium manausense]
MIDNWKSFHMLKRLCLALAGLFALATVAQGAGTVPGFSLTPQFDLTGAVAPGCKLYVYQAGTVATPQNAYSDSGLTPSLVLPNPLTCDAAGRLPQFFVADGLIKLRLTKSNGTQIFSGDNLLVVGPSSGGGGGGGTVDPTTVLTTGDIKDVYGTGVLAGFVRTNGRTIGSATSGATERANADTSALFAFLWNQDPNLAVSGGRGASAAADFAANKTIALPDFRDKVRVALGDMGNSNAGLFGPDYCISHTTLGFSCGGQTTTLVTANLPPYTPAGTITNGAITINNQGALRNTAGDFNNNGGGGGAFGALSAVLPNLTATQAASSFTGSAQGGTSTPLRTIQPSIFITTYIKL